VTRSGYYAWVKRPFTIRQREELRLELEIHAALSRAKLIFHPRGQSYFPL